MGVVYAVYDEELDRRVALELLEGGPSPQLHERLQREARALARLGHPDVVPVFEVGEHEPRGGWGRVFVSMRDRFGGPSAAGADLSRMVTDSGVRGVDGGV